jgi:hypothetical protein
MGKEQDRGRGGIDIKAAQELLNKKKKEKAEGGKGGFGDKRWFKLPDLGEVKLRFLPPIDGEPVPGMIVYKHYNLPEHEDLKGNITCFKTWGAECPICKVIEEFQDNFKDKLSDYYGASSYFNVLVLDQAGFDPTLAYILQSSDYTYEWVLSQVVNAEVGDITHVTEGANVTFRRKKKKGAFDRIISRRSSAIADTEDGIDDILDSMYDFKKIWREGDDNYYNIAEDLAEDLREIIKERLLKQPSGDDKDKPVKEVQDAKRRSGRGTEEAADKEPETRSRRSREVLEEAADKEPETPPRSRRTRGTEDAADKGEPEKEPETPPRSRRTRGSEPEKDSESVGNRPGGNKPASAPDCFGLEHKKGKKCNLCQYEYDCENNS